MTGTSTYDEMKTNAIILWFYMQYILSMVFEEFRIESFALPSLREAGKNNIADFSAKGVCTPPFR